MFTKKGGRSLVFLFVGLMCISLGFTGTVFAADKVELTLWIHSYATFMDVAQDQAARFEKMEPNVKIKIENFPYEQLITKVTPAFIAGTQPDMLEVPQAVINFHMRTGQLASVPTWIFTPEEYEEKFQPVGRGGLRLEKEGKALYYGIPFTCDTGWGPVILIDRDAFNEAGVDEKTWGTWDEFIKDMQKLTKKDATGKIVRSGLEILAAGAWGYAWFGGVYPHLAQGKIPQFNEDNTVAWDNEFGRKVLQTIDDFVNKWELCSVELADNVALGKKTAAAQMQGSWITGTFDEDFPDLNWDNVRIPNMPGAERPYYGTWSGWVWVVSEKSEHKEEAWKFLKFRAEPENAVQFALTTHEMPARVGATYDPRLANNPAFEKWIPVLPYQTYTDFGIAAEEVRKVIEDMMMGVWLKKYTVDESISNAAKKINDIRREHGEIKE